MNDKTVAFKGMYEQDGGSDDPSWAKYVENMERQRNGTWRTMCGAQQVGNWAEPTDSKAISGLVWFQPRPNYRFLVVEQAVDERTSALRYIDTRTDNPVTFATRGRVSGRLAGSQFLQFDEWLYHFNGLEQPVRWDGQVVRPMGFGAIIPAPTVLGSSQGVGLIDFAGATAITFPATPLVVAPSLQRGLGELPTEEETEGRRVDVAYGVTLVNDLGQESHMSATVIARSVVTGSGLRSHRVDVPVMPAHIMGVRLWRSVNLAGGSVDLPELYHLASFPMGGGFSFFDSTPDSELGELYIPESRGPIPARVRAAAWHHNAMWLASDSILWQSAPAQPEVFPPGNRYTVGTSGSGAIMSLWSVPRGLMVLCARGLYLVKGGPVEGYRVETVDEDMECVGPRAASLVDGIGLVVITTKGPFAVSGTLDDDTPTRARPIAGFEETWSRYLSPRGQFNALVIHRPELEEVWFHVCKLGELKPSLGFVYHYGAPGSGGAGWSLRPGWEVSSVTRYMGQTWLGSWNTSGETTAGVFLLNRGGVVLSATSSLGNGTPPDPSVPDSLTYQEPMPVGGGLFTFFWRTIAGLPIAGVYETGVLRSEERLSPQSVELIGPLTGAKNALQVEVRYDRRLHFEAIDDQKLLSDSHSEQTDQTEDSQHRPRWNLSTWDADGMWAELEVGAVRLPMPRQAQFDVQYRIRGVDLRLLGMRTQFDATAPKRRREVAS